MGEKLALFLMLAAYLKQKAPNKKKNKPPKTQQIFHEELMAETINCALQGGGNLRIAAD